MPRFDEKIGAGCVVDLKVPNVRGCEDNSSIEETPSETVECFSHSFVHLHDNLQYLVLHSSFPSVLKSSKMKVHCEDKNKTMYFCSPSLCDGQTCAKYPKATCRVPALSCDCSVEFYDENGENVDCKWNDYVLHCRRNHGLDVGARLRSSLSFQRRGLSPLS